MQALRKAVITLGAGLGAWAVRAAWNEGYRTLAAPNQGQYDQQCA